MNYREALAWLYSLQRFGIKLGLENIRRLIDELHVDLAGARVIHVAGTNGKGSVCAMIDSICRAQKYRTGLFTSPHLVTFRERIRVNGEMISEEAVAPALTKIRDLIAAWEPHPTFFEIATALALQHFATAKVDIVILETGMGGRLDATNVVQSTVAVITPIDFDHEKWLGDSLVKIATEKAGIIKLKVPVVSAPQKKDVKVVLQKRAAESSGPIEFVTEPYEQHPIALTGAQQKQNAALAVAAIRVAKIDIDNSTIARGLSSVDWPARFQRWDKHTIIDGAHNPAAAHTLVETWREIFDDQLATLILAILSDKDLHGICEALVPITDHVVLPRIRSARAANPQELAKILINLGTRCQICSTVADALENAAARNESILVTGSLHFAGEALAYLQGKPAAFEECAQ